MARIAKLNNEGFSTVESLLILVIVVIIGFVGWFVYHSNQQANKTIDTANQSNNNAQVLTTSSTKTSLAAGTRAKEIATELLNFNKANSTTALKTYVDKHVNDGQFTSSFKASVDNGSALVASSTSNPIYCTGTTAPNGFKVASSTLSGDSDDVTLTQVVTGSTSANAGPNITLTYAHSSWSIDKYSCQ